MLEHSEYIEAALEDAVGPTLADVEQWYRLQYSKSILYADVECEWKNRECLPRYALRFLQNLDQTPVQTPELNGKRERWICVPSPEFVPDVFERLSVRYRDAIIDCLEQRGPRAYFSDDEIDAFCFSPGSENPYARAHADAAHRASFTAFLDDLRHNIVPAKTPCSCGGDARRTYASQEQLLPVWQAFRSAFSRKDRGVLDAMQDPLWALCADLEHNGEGLSFLVFDDHTEQVSTHISRREQTYVMTDPLALHPYLNAMPRGLRNHLAQFLRERATCLRKFRNKAYTLAQLVQCGKLPEGEEEQHAIFGT